MMWAAIIAVMAVAMMIAVGLDPATVPLARRFGSLFSDVVVAAPFWALMTITAVAVSRRVKGPSGIMIHAALALSLAMAHMLLGGFVARAILGAARPPEAYQQWVVWNVLAYAAVVLVTRGDELREWLRARIRDEVTLNARMVDAARRLARLREMQALLLASLDEVIAAPTMESLDRAVVDFAEFLRGEVMPDAVGAAAEVVA
jgi:hypothetical protein